ncbi:MAG: mechanosensitive ion channel [Candidatus Eremiobacteraeota bacterium]|nr:mechanosensitive ion channel [Candidatus Eremiobacteraeota bacterium]
MTADSFTPTEPNLLVAAAWIIVAIAAGIVAHRIVLWALTHYAKRHGSAWAAALQRIGRPSGYVVPLVAVVVVIPSLVLPAAWTSPVLHLAAILTIGAAAWAVVAAVDLAGDVLVARHRVEVADDLVTRQLETRVAILTRTATTLVIIGALGMMLMTFPSIRAIGTTLLASAGLAGIVAGLAARPLFENLVAGVQIALSQPFRIDDVVVVEKQRGRIEEICSTYVVVRLWDSRRLVLPLTYFINTPFENWSRSTGNLIGEVDLYLDWSADVEEIRRELPQIVSASPLWDRQVQNVAVVDASENAMQVRCLVSAADATDLLDLRCFVRERLIAFVRDRQPGAFPHTTAARRIAATGTAGAQASSAPA